jgi:hypothetical protein
MLGVSSVAETPVSDTLDPEQPFGKLMRQAQNPFAVLQAQGATDADEQHRLRIGSRRGQNLGQVCGIM